MAKNLGKEFRDARSACYVTSAGLSVATGLSSARIRELESGRDFPAAYETALILTVLVRLHAAIFILHDHVLGEGPDSGSAYSREDIVQIIDDLWHDARTELLFERLEELSRPS